jgi:hypothetical protein
MKSWILFGASSPTAGPGALAVLLALLIMLPFILPPVAEAGDKAIVRLPSPPKESDVGVGDLYALVGGVSRYAHHPGIPNLSFSDKDAEDFADFLKTQKRLYRKLHITLLLNERATRAEMERNLIYELPKAGKDDTVMIFLSGHGAEDPSMPGEFSFLPQDSDPQNLLPTSVHMNRQWLLSKLGAKRVVLIADACQSSGFVQPGVKSLHRSLKKMKEDFQKSEGKVFITSSRADEVSREKPEYGNSVFTYHLLEALKGKAGVGKDGVVTLLQAYDYAYDQCKDEPGGGQHPQIAGNWRGRFPVALVKKSSPVSFTATCAYRSGGTGAAKPITDGAVLKSGDTYKIAFTPDEDVYAYIFQIDTGNQIFRLFPMKEFKGKVVSNFNPVRKGSTRLIPGKDKEFKLDRSIGKERIYFLAFKEPNEKIERIYLDLEAARAGSSERFGEDPEAKLHRYFKKMKGRGVEAVVDAQRLNVPWGNDLFSIFGKKVKELCEDCMYVLELIHE